MVLVTGAGGFVGSHVIRRLAGSGKTRALVHRRPVAVTGDADSVEGDVTRPESLAAAMDGIDVVVHAAAITGDRKEPYRGAYDEVNRVGTENVVAAARAAGVSRLVVVSGLGTRPAPSGTYMATRWAAEEAVRQGGIPYVILQPSVLFGDGSPFIHALANLIRSSPVVPVIGSGALLFQPLHVEDLVTCVERASTDEALLAGAYPLGGTEQLSFRELLQLLSRVMEKHRLVVPLPIAVARIQARLMTALLPNPPLTPAALELFSFDNATDLDAVERSFGFRPRGFREHVLAHGLEA